MSDEIMPTTIAADNGAQFIPGGRGLVAGAGWNWIATAWPMFTRQVGVWIGVLVVLLVGSVVLAAIPVVGTVATLVLYPVIAGGLMLGCRRIDEGGALSFAHLGEGFSKHFAPLALLGVAYLVALVAIALMAALFAGVGVGAIFGMAAATGPVAVGVGAMGIAVVILLAVAAMVPVYMALWFAPALVVLEGHDATRALKASFGACLKNVLPFLVYGVAALLLGIAASIPLALGWLALGPVLTATLYTSYQDVFYGAPNEGAGG
ncbi:MAG: BPSS1780 family membrane protein [Proteobacteria bacterium]|nr:BPSS1780 family membrane protein [Pseudomonadota bacterium]